MSDSFSQEVEGLVAAVEAAGSGGDAEAQIDALAAGLRAGLYEDLEDAEALTLRCMGHPKPELRVAGLRAARETSRPGLLAQMAQMRVDDEGWVRFTLAITIGTLSRGTMLEVLEPMLDDDSGQVVGAAARSTGGQPRFVERLRALLEHYDWHARDGAAAALANAPAEQSFVPLLQRMAVDDDSDVATTCAKGLEAALEAGGAPAVELPGIAVLSQAQAALDGVEANVPRLSRWLRELTEREANPELLAEFGTDLTARAQRGELYRAHGVDAVCAELERRLLSKPPQPVVLLGPSGCGKSSAIYELVHRLAEREDEESGWRVLRMSPSDFMAGAVFVGEWETRLKKLVEAIKPPKRVLLYMPNIEEMAGAGRSQSNSNNLAVAMGPYLADGAVVLLGETTPEAWERAAGRMRSVARLFDLLQMKAASEDTTRNVVEAVTEEAGARLEAGLLERLVELADHYIGDAGRPGNAVGLLRKIIAERDAEARHAPIALSELLHTLSASTGLPQQLLDDAEALRSEEARSFFEGRVMGQPEAVDAVVDLVTLIKAGLTDPDKPFGVLLFVGPTGVGKTELARALAEYVFGDPGRLVRLDMSEYASYEAFERLIGGEGRPGHLTAPIRRQPFSVVLLDELEKAHMNVYDLCLQLFDAGRLTDGSGRTVDFRRCVLILTSNVGAPTFSEGRVGFAAASEVASTRERTLRELGRVFRPEFLNRIDRIINFRPLSLEVAERIARRELTRVLTRGGITRRGLGVEVDDEVLRHLVREGYSPHLGARPLKRAVERIVLLPLARRIAGGKLDEGALLRLHLRAERVQVEVSSAPAKTERKRPPKPPKAQRNLRTVVEALSESSAELLERCDPLRDRKSERLQAASAEGAWDRPDEVHDSYAEVERLDAFLATVEGLHAAASNLASRLEGRREPADLKTLRDRAEALGVEHDQLAAILSLWEEETDPAATGDALLGVSLVDRRGEALGGVERVVGMYLGLARRRHLGVEVLAERDGDKPSEDEVWVHISGLGAYALLRGEAGLHQLSRREERKDPRTGKERRREDRDVVRVEVLPFRDGDGSPAELKTTVHGKRRNDSRFLKRPLLELSVFHEASLHALRGLAPAPESEAVARLAGILHARVASPGAEDDSAPVVRRYQLGGAQRVKDLRSGQSSTRLDRVLRGHIDDMLQLGTVTDG